MAELAQEKRSTKHRRLLDWNYIRAGRYFVTICARDRGYVFGGIRNGKMGLNEIGRIVEKFWKEIPKHFSFVQLDRFVVMPDHLHGILVIDGQKNFCRSVACNASTYVIGNHHETAEDSCNASTHTIDRKKYHGRYPRLSEVSPKQRSLSAIIRSFKSAVTKQVREKYSWDGDFWQARFHDRIIGSSSELEKIRVYIAQNPDIWEREKEF
ncbi:MAG: transposase [Patescibacteria group bacterium]